MRSRNRVASSTAETSLAASGVGHRFDAGGIDGLQLLDETEDAVELFARGFALGGGKLDTRQKGDAGDVFLGQGHDEVEGRWGEPVRKQA